MMRRREFITLLSGAAAWPLTARAQQLPAMPVIGYLGSGSPRSESARLIGLRRGLSETGYIEGRNLKIEYRWAEDQFSRLRALAAELVQARVAVIVTPGVPGTLAAKAATTTIPVVFGVGADPVQLGLVESLNRPGGNLTGFNQLNSELGAKVLALLQELVPQARSIGFLQNPSNPIIHELLTKDVLLAARAIGIEIHVLKATNDGEIDAAFESLVVARAGALLVGSDYYFNNRIDQIVALASRHAIPVMYPEREFVAAGGLMSYGAGLTETVRQVGVQVGRILNGKRPADLPVIQSSKFELVINLKTAEALGLDVPATLLARADEVIE